MSPLLAATRTMGKARRLGAARVERVRMRLCSLDPRS
jgi:hypothetical protein